MNLTLPAASFLVGVLLHWGVFRHGEWDMFAPTLCSIYTMLYFIAFAAIRYANIASTQSAYTLVASNVAGIISSMLIYRAFFHRLQSFPGPFWARLSNFYITWLEVKNMHLYDEINALHKEHGDYVRVGPTELSLANPEAARAIYSSQTTCVKGPWFNCLYPRFSLMTTRSKADHTRRRRAWDQAFSAKALRDYEPRITKYTNQLVEQIQQRLGEPMNMSDWSGFFAFDVMGDLAFGKSFGMLPRGKMHYFMTTLRESMTAIGVFGHLPWVFPFFRVTPILNSGDKKFWSFCHDQVEERKKLIPNRPDVFSPVLEDYYKQPQTPQAKLNLQGDAYLIVVAGSDTTSSTLTIVLFYLAQDPALVAKIRAEMSAVGYNANDTPDYQMLTRMRYLDAIIHETLRLHPAVPSGTQRVTSAQGLQIGDTFIPRDTIVQVPFHTLHRDERFWVKPLEFVPERWTEKRDMIKDETAFMPFSLGPYACLGQKLALMEMRNVIAQLVARYEISLAKDQKPKSFLDGKRDTFTLALAPLNLVFTPRLDVAN